MDNSDMKLGRTLLVLSSFIFLSGCVFPTGGLTSNPTSEQISTSSPTSEPTSIPTSESTSSLTSESTSASTSNPTSISTSQSTSNPTSQPTSISTSISTSSSISGDPELEAIPVNFTAINDFHGQLDEDGYQVGIAKMTSYLKEKKAEGNVLICSGDNYQGSLICNYDKGVFVSSIFKDIGFDAYTIGNHEFDWGVEYIKLNEEILGEKMLGANIYNYPKTDNQWTKSDLGELYKIITLYEGTPQEIKIGIIGVIGRRQITSITSTYVEDYIFLEPTQIVKDLAIELREEKGCDIVVASYHDASPDYSIADRVSGKNYHYVDACFMGHTHSFDAWEINNVPFVQGGAYSQGTSEVSLLFNKNTSTVTLNNYDFQYLSSLDLEPDDEVETAIQNIKDELYDKFYEVVGTNATGRRIDEYAMARFYAKITYEKALELGYEVDGCVFNQARRELKAGDFTYSDLFETHPFLNEVYIISADEYDIANQSSYRCSYLKPGFNPSYRSTHHDVLVFDYNGFHIGVNESNEKYYNYFPSAFNETSEHAPIRMDFNCFDIALEWLKTNEITSEDIPNY